MEHPRQAAFLRWSKIATRGRALGMRPKRPSQLRPEVERVMGVHETMTARIARTLGTQKPAPCPSPAESKCGPRLRCNISAARSDSCKDRSPMLRRTRQGMPAPARTRMAAMWCVMSQKSSSAAMNVDVEIAPKTAAPSVLYTSYDSGAGKGGHRAYRRPMLTPRNIHSWHERVGSAPCRQANAGRTW